MTYVGYQMLEMLACKELPQFDQTPLYVLGPYFHMAISSIFLV